MAALTCNFKLVRISYVDGCLTFYPNFQYYDDAPDMRNCLNAIVKACGEKEFSVKLLEDKKPSQENLKFVDMLGCLQFDTKNYSRFIQRKDVDHWLYHKDSFDYNDSHYHVKFQTLLTPELLSIIFDVCVGYNLLSQDDRKHFFDGLMQRYEKHHEAIDQLLTGKKGEDASIIRKHILQCEDNDVLAELHRYLLTDKFCYLRAPDNPDDHWQGTLNQAGDIGKGSIEWAMIEKHISLQLIKNITCRCHRLDNTTSQAYANELNHSLGFFSIKRKDNATLTKNSAFVAFTKADVKLLEEKYRKMTEQIDTQEDSAQRNSLNF